MHISMGKKPAGKGYALDDPNYMTFCKTMETAERSMVARDSGKRGEMSR